MSCSLMTAASAVSKPASRPSTASATCGFGSASASGQDADRRQIVQAMVGQHVAHALARALAPQRDDDALAGRLQRLHVPAHGVEHAGGVLGALGREIAARRARRHRSLAPPSSGTANGVSRASAAVFSRSAHSSSGR